MFYQWIFVCMTLIGVKSKYGSCSGNCTGLININNYNIKKYIIVSGFYSLYSSTAERNTVNILMYVQFILRAKGVLTQWLENCVTATRI